MKIFSPLYPLMSTVTPELNKKSNFHKIWLVTLQLVSCSSSKLNKKQIFILLLDNTNILSLLPELH